MPQFSFIAVGRDGKRRAGEEFADNRRSLELLLKDRKLLLVDCKTLVPRRVAPGVQLRLMTQLSQLIRGGLTSERSLQIISEHADDKRVAELARGLRQGIKRGQSLSQALAMIGQFDPLLVPLVRAGEASGRMPEILTTLATNLQARQKLRRSPVHRRAGDQGHPGVQVAVRGSHGRAAGGDARHLLVQRRVDAARAGHRHRDAHDDRRRALRLSL
jgi:type II secretory pathway component PulF